MPMFKSEGKVRELFRKYGKTALATHLTVYTVSFSGAHRQEFLTKVNTLLEQKLLNLVSIYRFVCCH